MLEKYRTSLEVSKKLKEAGFPQDDCDAYWCNNPEYGDIIYSVEDICVLDGIVYLHGSVYEGYAAPCVGRLAEELPWKIENHYPYTDDEYSFREEYECDGFIWVRFKHVTITKAETEADARALIWIDIKEKGLI